MKPANNLLPRLALTSALAPLLMPAAAWAHLGTDAAAHHGFAAGLAHPFTGLDHLAAMLAVGFWGTSSGARRAWLAPLAFASMVLIGALLAAQGVLLPNMVANVEPMIAASLLVFGLLIASRARLPAAAVAAIAGGFALFHGAAHGVELGGGTALAGMLLGTVVLHAAGMALGRWSARHDAAWFARASGAAVAALGSALLLASMLAGAA